MVKLLLPVPPVGMKMPPLRVRVPPEEEPAQLLFPPNAENWYGEPVAVSNAFKMSRLTVP
jgi:hypothetical protein